MLKVLDLFSGIGGFSLGLERTGGFETVAFCEIEPFCRRVLAKHWPNVKQYTDVRELTADRLRTDGIVPDVICGGFPCQDISVAGKGAGIEGERSGLWSEYARLIGELRPRYVIVENVAALLGRGLDRVLGDLAALGFDAEWNCIPASAVGAPHRRDRLWLVAYAKKLFSHGGEHHSSGHSKSGFSLPQSRDRSDHENLAHPDQSGLAKLNGLENCGSEAIRVISWRELERVHATSGTEQWSAEPNVGRVAHGVPSRFHRLRALGNAVVPQIPELIGHAIITSIKGETHGTGIDPP